MARPAGRYLSTMRTAVWPAYIRAARRKSCTSDRSGNVIVAGTPCSYWASQGCASAVDVVAVSVELCVVDADESVKIVDIVYSSFVMRCPYRCAALMRELRLDVGSQLVFSSGDPGPTNHAIEVVLSIPSLPGGYLQLPRQVVHRCLVRLHCFGDRAAPAQCFADDDIGEEGHQQEIAARQRFTEAI